MSQVVTKVKVKIIFKSGHVHDFKVDMKSEPDITQKDMLDGMQHFAKLICGKQENRVVDTVWSEIDNSSVMCVNTEEVAFVSIEVDQ